MGIRQDFERIKRLFFPRWDRAGLWRVTTNSSYGVHGRCDQERKRIEIVFLSDNPDEHDRLIIHEICHAVTNGGHETRWQDRMEAAAKQADKLKRTTLAILLRSEVIVYRNTPRSIDIVYGEIEDAMLESPNLTLAQIKKWIGQNHGILSKDVCKIFKRTKAVYLKAKKKSQAFHASDRELRKRFGDIAEQ